MKVGDRAGNMDDGRRSKLGHLVESATALRTEEKGSDVNLATHLLADVLHNDYDTAVGISARMLNRVGYLRYCAFIFAHVVPWIATG